MATNGRTTNPFFPPRPDFGQPGSGFTPPFFGTRVAFENEEVSSDSKSSEPSSSSEEDDYEDYDGDRDETSSERIPVRKSVQPRNIIHGTTGSNTPFGPNYERFFSAFGTSPRTPQPSMTQAKTVPAKRKAVSTGKKTKRQKPQERASRPRSDRDQASLVPTKRSAPAPASRPGPRRAEINERISIPPSADDVSLMPIGPAIVDEKEQTPQPKGSGLYKSGNWAWVESDEEARKVDEIAELAKELATREGESEQKPARVTRRVIAQIKSTKGSGNAALPSRSKNQKLNTPKSPAHTFGLQVKDKMSESPRSNRKAQHTTLADATSTELSPRSGTRKSGRARIIPDYTKHFNPEDDAFDTTPTAGSHELPTPEQTEVSPTSPIHPSISASSASNGSPLIPGQPTKSTSRSAAGHEPGTSSEQTRRPSLSWNAIIWEVLALSDTPSMTVPEIIDAVKERHPYFRSEAQARVIQSSAKNPLHFHDAFCRVPRADNAVAWGLRPGEWLDKKTKKVLTPVPRHTISDSKTHGQENQTASQQTGEDLTVDSPSPALPSRSSALASSQLERSPPPRSTELSEVKKSNGEKVVSKAVDDQIKDGLQMDSASGYQDSASTQLDNREFTRKATPDQQPKAVQSSPSPSSAGDQSSASPPLVSKDQRTLEGIVHLNLVDVFKPEEMNQFLQETKLSYFKNMDLKAEDTARIFKKIFPYLNGSQSSAEEMDSCARDIRKHYETMTWGSDWFLKFVKDQIAEYDGYAEILGGPYMGNPKPWKLNWWLHSSRWKLDTLKILLSPLSDAVDVDKIWSVKHPWQDFMKKVFPTACDAIWELLLQPAALVTEARTEVVYTAIRAAVNDRFPDRTSHIWDVPRVQPFPPKPADRKASIARSNPVSRKSSVVASPRAEVRREPMASVSARASGSPRASNFGHVNLIAARANTNGSTEVDLVTPSPGMVEHVGLTAVDDVGQAARGIGEQEGSLDRAASDGQADTHASAMKSPLGVFAFPGRTMLNID